MLDNTTITIIAVVIIICFLGIYIFVYRSDVKEMKKAEKQPAPDKSLQLQAHERLTITNLKEQNIFIIHQLENTLPQGASGPDLCKHILELLDADPKTSLHTVVIETLRFDAKKIMSGV